MSKKSFTILFALLVIVLLGTYYVIYAFKDDALEIEKELDSFGLQNENVIHIEYLGKNKAIAFFTSAFDPPRFGHALVKKGIWGWKLLGSSSSEGEYPPEMKLGWSFQNFENEKGINFTDLIYGKIIDNHIKEIKVMTLDNEEYSAEIIHNGSESFWYLLSEHKDLDTATIIGLSETDEVIFEYPER